MTTVVLMATPCTKSLGGRSGGTRGREEVRGVEFAGRSPPSSVGTAPSSRFSLKRRRIHLSQAWNRRLLGSSRLVDTTMSMWDRSCA